MSVELCVTWSNYFYSFCYFESVEEVPGVRKAAIMQKIPGKSWQQTKRGFLSRRGEFGSKSAKKEANLHITYITLEVEGALRAPTSSLRPFGPP